MTVVVLDENDNRITDYTGTVHFASSDSQAVLPADYTFTSGDNGLHTFAVTLKTASIQTVTVTDTANPALTVNAVIQVTLAVTSLEVTGFPSPIEAGVPGSFTVTAKDAFGNIATGYTGTIHFSTSALQADLPLDSTLTNGTGTFTATLNTPGVQSITATDTVNGALTGTQGSITVTPGYAVTNTADVGTGSLRQAILNANANPGVDVIRFSIGSGVKTISPMSALPAINGAVTIDGTTQPGYAGTPLIVLSGANIPSATGLFVSGGSSTIQGLVVNGFSTGTGIRLETGGGNLITGNYIGTNAAGTAAVGNGTGISMTSASNTVGGTTAATRNVISGNGTGISSLGSNVIHGNYIGTDASGTLGLGNLGNGVFLSGSNNLVGGTTAGAANRIAFNGGLGVAVDTATGNAIRQNTIFSNGGLGIDLINGGNNNQAKPSVNAATSGGGTTTITVTLVSASSTTYTLDFFSSATCDSSTFGEGETYLGSKTLTTKTTGRGRTIFVAGTEVPVGHVITATATSPGNDTSEFSKCWTVT